MDIILLNVIKRGDMDIKLLNVIKKGEMDIINLLVMLMFSNLA